jgi:hypothetical protein
MPQVARIPGRVVNFFGGASKAISLQKPLLRKYFSEIDKCHDGTINVLLGNALQVSLPDIVTPPIAWDPANPHADERFGITEIELEIWDTPNRAWLYTAERSSHRFNNMIAEVIAEPINGIVAGLDCAILIKRFHQLIII